MSQITAYINSGILELYVLGVTTAQENIEVNAMAKLHTEISNEINAITNALVVHSEASAPALPPALQPLIVATIDYMHRIENGETVTYPPLLNKNATLADYSAWLTRSDMIMPEDADDIYVKIIGASPQTTTTISWLKTSTPNEIHTDEYEHFLIVEGTCTFTIGATQHHLSAGDYIAIPLHVAHSLQVTSLVPCKVILQRTAA